MLGSLSRLKANSSLLRLMTVAGIILVCLFRWQPKVDHSASISNSGYESLQVANSLAHDQGFANPFDGLKSGPTAHLAPVFPFFLSIFVRLFGDGAHAYHIIQWAVVLALAVQLGLLPFVAQRLGMGFGSGVLASILLLLTGFEPATMWEADYAACLTLPLSTGMYRLLMQRSTNAYVVLLACLWGFTILLLPVVLVPFSIFALWVIFRSSATTRQKLAFVAVPVLWLVPWSMRNYNTFHHIFFIRDNLGLELSVSNNECANFSLIANQLTWCYLHPNEDTGEALRVRDLGEYAYNQKRLQEAKAWIVANPGRFATLTVQRAVAFWFPNGSGNPFTSTVTASVKGGWLITLISIPGLLLLWWKDRTAAGICLVWLLSFPCIYYLTQFDVRYREPILWATAIPAAYVFTHVADEFFGRWRAAQALSFLG